MEVQRVGCPPALRQSRPGSAASFLRASGSSTSGLTRAGRVSQASPNRLAGHSMEIPPSCAASNVPRPWAQQGPRWFPPGHAPVPPLARAGFSKGDTAVRRSRSAITVLAALQDDHLSPITSRLASRGKTACVSKTRSPAPAYRRRRRHAASGTAHVWRQTAASRYVGGPPSTVRERTQRPPRREPPASARRPSSGARRPRISSVIERARATRATTQRVVVVVEKRGPAPLGIHFLDIVLRQRQRRGLDDLRGKEGLQRLGVARVTRRRLPGRPPCRRAGRRRHSRPTRPGPASFHEGALVRANRRGGRSEDAAASSREWIGSGQTRLGIGPFRVGPDRRPVAPHRHGLSCRSWPLPWQAPQIARNAGISAASRSPSRSSMSGGYRKRPPAVLTP